MVWVEFGADPGAGNAGIAISSFLPGFIES